MNDFGEEIGEYRIIRLGKKLRSFAKIDQGIPYLAELYIALNYYKIPKEELKLVCRGAELDKEGKPYPDIFDEKRGILASVKWRFDRMKTYKFSQQNDFTPEYRTAIKLEKKYDFVFMNPIWDDKLRVKEIDPIKDDDEVKIQLKPLKKLVM